MNNEVNFDIGVIELAKYEAPQIVEDSQDDWAGYGVDNSYWKYLIDRYKNSSTLNAVLNNISKLIYGGGLEAVDAFKNPSDWANLISLMSPEDLQSIIIEYAILGNATIQVGYNPSHTKTLWAKHIPVYNFAAKKCNEKGVIEGYYYSDNWEDTRKFKPKLIPAFGESKSEIEILWVKKYSIGQKYYAIPDYIACIPYAILEEEIANYLINETQNGFSGTKVINVNGNVPDAEKREEIRRNFEKKLTGSKGVKVITSFSNGIDSKITVDDIPLNDAPEHYQYLSDECLRKILTSNGVTSPLLFGIATTTGLSSNADEMKNAFNLYVNQVIKPMQNVILSALNKISMFNGYSLNLRFKSLNPFLMENQEETVTMSKHEIDDHLFNKFNSIGHELGEEWELVSSEPVDYVTESEKDKEIELRNEDTFFQKLAKIIKTGTAKPYAGSELDTKKFITRYRYHGSVNSNSRDFCKKMVNANKLYRKEDILAMNSQIVNEGFGPGGADTYDIWLYKGGARCHHVWMRETYRRNTDVKSPLAEKVTPAQSRKEGEILPKAPAKVYQKPNDMPNNGFLPK